MVSPFKALTIKAGHGLGGLHLSHAILANATQ
jgi:hypothetical protein